MKFKSGGERREWISPAPGTTIGRCFKFIDLGTQETQFIDENTGKPKFVHKIRLEFELPNRTIEVDGIKKPMIIGKDYTASMHEKATFRLHQESRIGRKFTDEEAEEYEATSVVGEPCLLSIASGDKGGAYIASMSGIPEGMDVPEQFNENLIFLLEDYNEEIFESLPGWLKDKIKVTKEYKAAVKRQSDPMPDLEEDVPF